MWYYHYIKRVFAILERKDWMKVKPLLTKVKANNFIEDYLSACGIDDVKQYLCPIDDNFDSPWDYPNMSNAIAALYKAVCLKYKIGIVMDSDLDGTCSAAIMTMFLRELGVEPVVFAHEGKQHGLNDLIDQITGQYIDTLIVPDAGSNDVIPCKELRHTISDIIVLDHHEITADNPYAIIVNHHLGQGLNTALSGTGVTDKFIQAYCETYDISKPYYDDIVAVSLVSDVCDLRTIENRAYLFYGLNHISNPFLSLLYEKCCKKNGQTPTGIGWDIAPLANALARVDNQEAKLLFYKALIGDGESYDKTLTELRRIKRQQDEATKAAMGAIEPTLDLDHKVIIGFGEVEDKNYLGLICNKFLSKYHKPVILLKESNPTTWSGSLRSPVELADKINESKLAKAMGHQSACGIVVKKSMLKRFAKWIDELDLSAQPDIPVTAIVNGNDISLDLCNEIERNMQLWGQGVEAPTFYISTVVSQDNIAVFRKNITTIRITVENLTCLLFFAKDEDVSTLTSKSDFRLEMIVKNCKINSYNGVDSPQCEIAQYEVHDIPNEDVNDFDWDDLFK